MTDDEKLSHIMEWAPISNLGIDVHPHPRDMLAAIRAAGWILIPPLDTEEGREAVEKMLSTWFDDESVEIISAAISAAGGA